jgi:branched-subunit amino acid aminotransferase/4-amino-4-deoxychorismate lyase
MSSRGEPPHSPDQPRFWLWNGRVVAEAEVALSPWDRGFRYGDGLYETVRVHRGRPFGLNEHLARMEQGLALLELDLNPRAAFPPVDLERLIEAAGLEAGEGRLRLFVTRGTDRGSAPPPKPAPTPTRLATIEPLLPRADPSDPRPLKLATVSPVMPRPATWAGLKSLNHLPYVLAAAQAERAGADDALLVYEGKVKETTSANVFMVRDGQVTTPPTNEGILAGVTRDLLLQLTRELKLHSEERPIPLGELLAADEIFTTGSVAGVRAVESVDGRRVEGRSSPGSIIQRLRAAYANHMDSVCC